MASDDAVTSVASEKQSVASDDRRPSGQPQLESFLTRVLTSLSNDSHNAVSKALKAYDQFVLKEFHNIHANQQKIEEAQR
jgi:hypothetical protein